MNLSKPNKSTVDVADKGARLLSQLIEFYDAIIALGRATDPTTVYTRARLEAAKAVASFHP